MGWIALVAPVALIGCGQGDGAADRARATEAAPSATAAARPATAVTDEWLGKWVGVEGLALVIARGDRPGTYRLHIALMDGATDHIGTADGDMIRFTRAGRTETIRATTGDATGLKWLAEKKNCLTIRPGEGFCRG